MSNVCVRAAATHRRHPGARLAPAALVVCLVTACASGGGAAGGTTAGAADVVRGNIRTEGGSGSGVADIRVNRTNVATSLDVDGSPEDVYASLPLAFDRLGLQPTESVPANRQLGAVEQQVRRRVGRVPVSTYLTCGRGGLSAADNADTYNVQMTVQTVVTPGATPTSSRLTTRVFGSARPSSSNASAVNCETVGGLEERLVAEVRTILAANGKTTKPND